ncbi:hypothetical protein TrVE_jg2074 [Triparma verrucosa]|uniref:Uncharacterized protein n=1 Tax=Triparma verrucosa TaxID=1606542 RepID=A0A9W7F254_9STRA|nr:hypothetical protein TrVE_jg2074 [Triparma verrucosa]
MKVPIYYRWSFDVIVDCIRDTICPGHDYAAMYMTFGSVNDISISATTPPVMKSFPVYNDTNFQGERFTVVASYAITGMDFVANSHVIVKTNATLQVDFDGDRETDYYIADGPTEAACSPPTTWDPTKNSPLPPSSSSRVSASPPPPSTPSCCARFALVVLSPRIHLSFVPLLLLASSDPVSLLLTTLSHNVPRCPVLVYLLLCLPSSFVFSTAALSPRRLVVTSSAFPLVVSSSFL